MSRTPALGTALVASALFGGCTLLFDPGEGSPGGEDTFPDDDFTDASAADAGSCGQVLATYATPDTALAAAVVKNRVVVTWEGGIDLLDARDPRRPERLDSQSLTAPAGEVAVSDCPACAAGEGGRGAARAFVAGAGGVEAFLPDRELATVGRLRAPDGAVAVVADADGTRILAALGDGELVLVDVADLGTEAGTTRSLSGTSTAPTLPCPPLGLALTGRSQAAALLGPSGSCAPELWLFDLGAAAPRAVVPLAGGATQIAVVGPETLLLAGGTTGLQRVSFGDGDPRVDPIPLPRATRAVAVAGSAALAVGAGALTVVDLATDEPAVVAEIELPGDPRAVATTGALAIVAAGDAGLVFVDVSCFVPSPTLDDGRPEPVR